MSENTNARTPDGAEEATRVELGEATRLDPQAARELRAQERPDLDLRQQRMSSRRKQAGPPMPRTTARAEAVPPPENETPTDPAGGTEG